MTPRSQFSCERENNFITAQAGTLAAGDLSVLELLDFLIKLSNACDRAGARNYTGSKWRPAILGSMDCRQTESEALRQIADAVHRPVQSVRDLRPAARCGEGLTFMLMGGGGGMYVNVAYQIVVHRYCLLPSSSTA